MIFLNGLSIILAETNTSSRRYKVKSLGYDISRVEHKVIELCNIEKKELYSDSRKKPISEAKSLFCYLCVREPWESMTSMAKS